MSDAVFIDSFDHDAPDTTLRGEALDRHVLSNSKRVSSFWITETIARAERVTKWTKSGRLKLTPEGFPWSRIDYFVPDVPRDLETLADSAPTEWDSFANAFAGKYEATGRELARAIEVQAERLMLLAEYLGTRLGSDGCGVHDHATAAKEVAKLHKKLRKTLGYSYPEQGVLRL